MLKVWSWFLNLGRPKEEQQRRIVVAIDGYGSIVTAQRTYTTVLHNTSRAYRVLGIPIEKPLRISTERFEGAKRLDKIERDGFMDRVFYGYQGNFLVFCSASLREVLKEVPDTIWWKEVAS